jgi:hypothetical protein
MATTDVTIAANSSQLVATALDTVYISTEDTLPLKVHFALAAPAVTAAGHPLTKDTPFSASGVGTLNTYVINRFNRAIVCQVTAL